MKKLWLLLALTYTLCSSYAQVNLVPNPSFEEYTDCPESLSWIGSVKVPYPWSYNNYGTPDYFNSCNLGDLGVPQNVRGFQDAYSGSAYAGIFVYGEFGINDKKLREFLSVELAEPLKKGNTYRVEFYVSPADYEGFVGINKMQALLSYEDDFLYEDSFIFDSTKIINYTGEIISNEHNWVLIQGDYIASGGEKFITIGNFSHKSEVEFYGSTEQSSYYYVDEVSIVDNGNAELTFEVPNVFTPNNDGINDEFSIMTSATIEIELTVYNRWGEIVFTNKATPNDFNTAFIPLWDGTNLYHEICNDGVYFYNLQLRSIRGESIIENGTIQLLK